MTVARICLLLLPVRDQFTVDYGKSCTNSGMMKNAAKIYLGLWESYHTCEKLDDFLAAVGKTVQDSDLTVDRMLIS